MANRPDITLYTAQTPNGIKISIALEELGYVSSLEHGSWCCCILVKTEANTETQNPIQDGEDRAVEEHAERRVCGLTQWISVC